MTRELSPAEALARLRLARTEGVGPQTYRRVMARFGGAAAALAELPRYGRGTLLPPAEGTVRREMEAVARLGGLFGLAWCRVFV